MNGGYNTSSHSDDQRREFVLDFIKQKDLIKAEDNLIRSEKVFVVNAVLKWCYEKAHAKKMTPTLWAKYKKMIAQFLKGLLKIFLFVAWCRKFVVNFFRNPRYTKHIFLALRWLG